jgi:hypothetical protein
MRNYCNYLGNNYNIKMSGTCPVIIQNNPRKGEACGNPLMQNKAYCYAHREEWSYCRIKIPRGTLMVHVSTCDNCMNEITKQTPLPEELAQETG